MCSSIRYPRPYRSYVRHSHELHDDDECEHGLIYSSHGRGHESRSYSANNESWHINVCFNVEIRLFTQTHFVYIRI